LRCMFRLWRKYLDSHRDEVPKYQCIQRPRRSEDHKGSRKPLSEMPRHAFQSPDFGASLIPGKADSRLIAALQRCATQAHGSFAACQLGLTPTTPISLPVTPFSVR
jgi:hypothetical protein